MGAGLRSDLNLTRELAITNFKLKYTGSVLGYAWSLVKPLLIFGMTYVVFVEFLLRGRTGKAENFPVQLLVGIVVWTFFADATGASVPAIVNNGHMIRKAYFPRWIPVVASTLSAAMTLFLNLILMIAIGVPLHFYQVGFQALLIPLLFVELYVLVLGIGLLLSSLFVYFRDLGHVWEIMVQLLFYGSAIIFPFSLIPGRFRVIVGLNPAAQIIEDMRRALVSKAIPWDATVLGWLAFVPFTLVVVIAVAGALTFRRLSPRFAESL
ncbi:MAG: ABC transporter permease [Candidatus Dormibacteraeota bacterium]|nr:ABC transporter permease [Candidatus Dormibacteraeota bacterium]